MFISQNPVYYKSDENGRYLVNRIDWHGLSKMVARGEIYCAYIDQEIVGCVGMKVQKSVLFLSTLCVKPERMGNGIGGKLMREFGLFPPKMPFDHVEIDVLYHPDLENSERLVSWYKKLGYELQI